MHKFFTFFTVLSILLISTQATAGVIDSDAMVKSRLLEGQGLLFARKYDEALKIFHELKRDYPRSPSGCFGEMAVYEIQMIEREDRHLQGKFDAAAKEGLRRVDGILQLYAPSPWDLFISGALLGLDGFFKARMDKWWAAYVLGNKSRQLFHHVKEIDPGYVDADFGLGMYLYWRSVFTKDLWFLRFFPDKREEGIAIVENVARNGHFAKELAKANLAIAYFEEKRYGDALKVLDEFVNRYPDNVILRRLLGKTLVAEKRYDAAVEQFRAILAVDSTFKKPHYFIGATLILKGDPKQFPEAEKELRYFLKAQGGKYWPASAHYWLGRLEEKKGNKKAALREYKLAHKLNPKIKDALKRARGMGSGL